MKIESLRLSDSSMNAYHACNRLLEFSKFYGLRIRTSGIPADIGKMMHSVYQEYFKTKNKTDAFTKFLQEYPKDAIASTPAYRYSIESCYSTILEMFNHNIAGEYEIANINTPEGIKPAIEVPIQINIQNFSLDDYVLIPVTYVGFIDFILYDLVNDLYVVVDIKTHSNNIPDLSPKFRFAEQCLPYAMVLEKILGHQLDNFKVMYFTVYIDLEEPRAQLYTFHKTREDINDWVQNFGEQLRSIKTHYQNNWFPRNGGHCMAFRKPCTYYDFCETRSEAAILSQLSLHVDAKPEIEINPWFTMDLKIEGL